MPTEANCHICEIFWNVCATTVWLQTVLGCSCYILKNFQTFGARFFHQPNIFMLSITKSGDSSTAFILVIHLIFSFYIFYIHRRPTSTSGVQVSLQQLDLHSLRLLMSRGERHFTFSLSSTGPCEQKTKLLISFSFFCH